MTISPIEFIEKNVLHLCRTNGLDEDKANSIVKSVLDRYARNDFELNKHSTRYGTKSKQDKKPAASMSVILRYVEKQINRHKAIMLKRELEMQSRVYNKIESAHDEHN